MLTQTLFNLNVTFSVKAESNISAELTIFNIKGQKFKTVSERIMKKGTYTDSRDGNDQLGEPCRSGIYFEKLIGNGKQLSLSKIKLLR